MRAQVAQPRRFEFAVERGDADQQVARVVEALAGVDGAFDRRHRGPELVVEVPPEVRTAGFVEPSYFPAVDRPVGQRVALARRLAEGALPGAGVAEMKVKQDAVGVEGDEVTGHPKLYERSRSRGVACGALAFADR